MNDEMEYRAYIAVPGLPFANESAWEPLAHDLEEGAARDYGPILSWDRRGLTVTLSTDAPTESDAARLLYDAVADSLRTVGLAHHYPSAVEIEPADDRQPVPA